MYINTRTIFKEYIYIYNIMICYMYIVLHTFEIVHIIYIYITSYIYYIYSYSHVVVELRKRKALSERFGYTRNSKVKGCSDKDVKSMSAGTNIVCLR